MLDSTNTQTIGSTEYANVETLFNKKSPFGTIELNRYYDFYESKDGTLFPASGLQVDIFNEEGEPIFNVLINEPYNDANLKLMTRVIVENIKLYVDFIQNGVEKGEKINFDTFTSGLDGMLDTKIHAENNFYAFEQ